MDYNLNNKIVSRPTKDVYKDRGNTIKLFVEYYSKADILNEAKKNGKMTYAELATKLENINPENIEKIFEAFDEAGAEMDDDAESIITNERYIYIGNLLKGIYHKKNKGNRDHLYT